jgi:hypothetical protein
MSHFSALRRQSSPFHYINKCAELSSVPVNRPGENSQTAAVDDVRTPTRRMWGTRRQRAVTVAEAGDVVNHPN